MEVPLKSSSSHFLHHFRIETHGLLGIHHLKIAPGRLQLLQAVSASLMWTARWPGSRMWRLPNAAGRVIRMMGISDVILPPETWEIQQMTGGFPFPIKMPKVLEGFGRLGSDFSWPKTTKEASLLIGTSSIWSYDHYTKRPAVLPALQSSHRVCWRGWSEEDGLTYLASIEWLNKHQIKYKQYKHHVHLVSWAFHQLTRAALSSKGPQNQVIPGVKETFCLDATPFCWVAELEFLRIQPIVVATWLFPRQSCVNTEATLEIH